MQIVFRLAYSLAVAILFVLFVILGTRTFYDEPEPPAYPTRPFPFAEKPPSPGQELSCDFDGRCFKGGREIRPEDEAALTEQERLYIQEQRDFQRRQREYEDDRVDYHRNVFIIAMVLGVAAIAAGLYLFRRVEAMPLGLLLGGLGVAIFAWAQAAGDFDEIGMAPLFAVVGMGLAIVLAAGYWLLAVPRTPAGNGGPSEREK